MAEADDNAERTEDPTPQRREDFRKKGKVAQSKELASVLIVFTSLLIMWGMGRFFMEQLFEVFTRSFSDFVVISSRQDDWIMAAKFAVTKSALIVGPIAIILWTVNVAASVMQIGFLNNEEALKFELDHINPINGFKKIFSLRAVVEGVKAIIKLSIVATIVYFLIKGELSQLPHLISYDVNTLFVYIANILFKLLMSVGIFMAVVAAFDYFYQRWELEKKMRMTKQEVKEEIKSREGDPLIRARVRKLQRELSQRRMMDDVKKADVIITNPTHIAIALQYTKEMIAPKLIAKGAGEIAEKIKKTAKEFNIPIVENKPLARTIFKTLKLGQIIPRELYTAVAEVLSYIYKLKRRRA